jgi:Na+/H+ antiporter NhaD/arsenite permease-like protein
LLLILIIFLIGYTCITLEHSIGINKAATALLTGVLCWVAYLFYANDTTVVTEQLMSQLGETSGILFFLVGAMTVVQLIDAHDGFHIIANAIKTTNKRKLLWIISFLSFFLSAVLDNLTTTIVMISLLRTLISDRNDRWFFAGMVIIAANAGGAWSPIGDVTTTMLWIGGQITVRNIILTLILPSLTCLLLPLLLISLKMKGKIERPIATVPIQDVSVISAFHRNLVLFCGMSVLVLIPVFKSMTHLPPFMGMLFGLGCLWVLSEIIHKDRDTVDKDMLSVVYALRKIDVPSILFFLGILLAISALQTAGHLTLFASFLEDHIHSQNLIATIIGLCSAIVDNVPLVAACTGMYDLNHFATDHPFWEFIAYCTGTGGSVLIIGSAAGVAAMGMENIGFFWYLKKISWLALIGYFGGALVYILFFG